MLSTPTALPAASARAHLRRSVRRLMALSLALHGASALAQEQATASESLGYELEEIVVTGYRKSLQSASFSKQESPNIIDSVFAEDIGKFADLNIAEALNRVPGIQLTREIDGTGLNVAIRGLNTNFTKVTLNNTPIAVASSGRTDGNNGNREVDLDLFPIEFFSQLTVNKTPVASMPEGGVAGTVNIRTTRPFDSPKDQLGFDAQLVYGELGEQVTPRGSVTGTWKNSDESLGVFVGLSGVNNHIVTRGYETVGWTNPALTYSQCLPSVPAGVAGGIPAGVDCNPMGGDGWVIGFPVNRDAAGNATTRPGYHVVPANTTITGPGGAVYGPGAVLDRAALLALNPGLSIEQISDGLIPRLGRPHYGEGDRNRAAGLVSLEYIPNELVSMNLDVLLASNDRDSNRLDMMMVARNSGLIPVNLQVDDNNVVTSGDFYNAQFFLEARPYQEELDFYNINPGVRLDFTDDLALDLQFNSSKSDWSRVAPTAGLVTNLNSGIATHFDNTGSGGPVLTPNVDLNDPAQAAGWAWERAFVQKEERETQVNQARADLQWGDPVDNIKFGLHFDQAERDIRSYDNSFAWEQQARATIANGALAGYLRPGPDGFVQVDYDAIFSATDYGQYLADAPLTTTSATSALTGAIAEDTFSSYLEWNHEFMLGERVLRANAGARYVRTDQEVTAPQNFSRDEQGQQVVGYVTESASYSEVLPSMNLSFEVLEGLMVRAAASKTMTRANPTELMPAINFTDTSAQTAFLGNPNLKPYTSLNYDVGVEWYSGREGYVALTYFRKDIEGFTAGDWENVPFSRLGIAFDSLSAPQQTAINQRGGPDAAVVQLITPVNATGNLLLDGIEFTWVQPLDILLEGAGFSVNYTHVTQDSKGEGVPTFATYVSENTANLTTYYENHGFSARLSYVWYDEQLASPMGQNNINSIQRYVEPRGQWDLSASYEFAQLPTSPAITLNVVNLGGDPQRENFGFDNAPFLIYDPGMTVMLGVRGKLFF